MPKDTKKIAEKGITMTLWVCGQWRSETEEGLGVWDFQGIFENEDRAVQACKGREWFIWPVNLNEEMPVEPIPAPNGYFPLAQTRESSIAVNLVKDDRIVRSTERVVVSALNSRQIKKLERLQRYGTRYEIVAQKGGKTILIGYAGRASFSGLLAMIRQNGEKFLEYTGAEDVNRKGKTAVTENGWVVKFSGRTQRSAITEGEHKFIGDL